MLLGKCTHILSFVRIIVGFGAASEPSELVPQSALGHLMTEPHPPDS